MMVFELYLLLNIVEVGTGLFPLYSETEINTIKAQLGELGDLTAKVVQMNYLKKK